MRAITKLSATAVSAAALVCCSAIADFGGLVGTGVYNGEGGPFSIPEAGFTDGSVWSDGGGNVDMDGGGLVDAPHPTVCDPKKPFGAPVPLSSINTSADETGARLTHDELTIYFASTRGSSFDLYRATRSAITDTFAMAKEITELDSPLDERSPSVKDDQLVLMYDSNREGGVGGRDIYLGIRASTGLPFSTNLGLGALNGTGDDSRPYMLPSALVVYFESDRSGSGDVFRASRAKLSDSFSAPVLVAEVSSAAEDGYSIANDDDTVLYFASQRSGGAAAFDVWLSTRATAKDSWGAPSLVPELNSKDDDAPTWISPDLCRIYIMSTRGGTSYDAYVATRSP